MVNRLFTFEGRLNNPNWGIVAIRVDYKSEGSERERFTGMIFVQFANRWIKRAFELFFKGYNRMDLHSYDHNLRLVISDATRPITVSSRPGKSTGAARTNLNCWDCDGPFVWEADPQLEAFEKTLSDGIFKSLT